MGAPVAWFDNSSADPKALVDLQRDPLDWTTADRSEPGYTLVENGARQGAIGAGIGATRSPAGHTIGLWS